ncbi:hypothetical protein [Sodalis sp. RH22]|uniref:hypothetical protein n=1 Tax=unclassified Sodalis (in: enterobacteria) TaxID=2636512 RepID=UPI0039B5881A
MDNTELFPLTEEKTLLGISIILRENGPEKFNIPESDTAEIMQLLGEENAGVTGAL